MYFRNYGLRKTWLNQCRKSPVSRDPSESNIANPPNIVQICMAEPLTYLWMTVQGIEFQKFCVSDMQNLKTFS